MRLAISLGDVTGVGPEVTLKALAALPANGVQFTLLGDISRVHALNSALQLGLEIESSAANASRIVISNSGPPLPEHLPPGSPIAAEAAMASLRTGAEMCLQQRADALVTAPVNKAAIIKSGRADFVGQTEFLSGLAQTSRTAMMLVGDDGAGHVLRVALATIHIPIKAVSERLTTEKILSVIELASESCHLLGLPLARVAVCGLNPHAGESGEIGREEIDVIEPAVRAADARGLDVHGPFPADSLFYHAYHGRYEAVVAMYHDQGLVPLKMIGFDRGINWTLGLPFIRTSPDHGTAYDIAGQNKANPSSMIAAINLACALAKK